MLDWWFIGGIWWSKHGRLKKIDHQWWFFDITDAEDKKTLGPYDRLEDGKRAAEKLAEER